MALPTNNKRTLRFNQISKSTGEVYECRVWLDDEKKLILKMDCPCWNFQNRRISKVGKVHTIKFAAIPCKHLAQVVDLFQRQGYTIRNKDIKQGSDRCTAEIRRAVLATTKGCCNFENCNITENIEIHRLLPKIYGGKYSLMNCVPLCREHHQLVHSKKYSY